MVYARETLIAKPEICKHLQPLIAKPEICKILQTLIAKPEICKLLQTLIGDLQIGIIPFANHWATFRSP